MPKLRVQVVQRADNSLVLQRLIKMEFQSGMKKLMLLFDEEV